MIKQNLLKKSLKPAVFSALEFFNSKFGGVMTPHGFINTKPQTNPSELMSLVRGRYEQDELNTLRAHFLEASIIIEIGSNIGVVASEALRTRLSQNGKIICVEPDPHAIEPLKMNLKKCLYGSEHYHTQNFAIVNAALCSPKVESGELVDFFSRPNLSSGLVGQVRPNSGEEPTVQVRAISLSSILELYKVKSDYSLIIDAEGAEIPMIFDDADALENCTQIAIEIHSPDLTGSDKTVQDIVNELTRIGFAERAKIGSNYYFEREFHFG